MTLHARQELVRRLDAYEHASAPRFKEVAAFIEAQVVPVIVRHALAGRCVVKTESTLFEDPTAVDMVLDTLAERGYHAVYEEHRTPVPAALRPATGASPASDRVEHTFEIRFHPPEIRRGQSGSPRAAWRCADAGRHPIPADLGIRQRAAFSVIAAAGTAFFNSVGGYG